MGDERSDLLEDIRQGLHAEIDNAVLYGLPDHPPPSLERGKMFFGDEVPSPIKIEQFRRKTFDVDAVQVTPDNIEDVAAWCGGDVRTEQQKGKNVKFVKVRVYKALDEEQTKAFAGNYVVYMGSGYKVYKYNAFMRTFERLSQDVEHSRDAGTGRFVTEEFAEANPKTTVTETQN